MRCTVTGAKGRSVAGAEEGEALPMWRNWSVASVKEGEALPMQRNWSVADSEKSKRRRCSDCCESFVLATVQVLSAMSQIWRNRSVVDAQIVANHLYWWWFRFCWWRLLATSPIWRNQSVADAQIVANRSYRWRLLATSSIWRNRCVVDAQIVVNCLYRRQFKWVIGDGSGLSVMVQVGYRRWNRFYWRRLSAMDWVLKNCRLVSFGIGVGLVLLGTKDWRLMRK